MLHSRILCSQKDALVRSPGHRTTNCSSGKMLHLAATAALGTKLERVFFKYQTGNLFLGHASPLGASVLPRIIGRKHLRVHHDERGAARQFSAGRAGFYLVGAQAKLLRVGMHAWKSPLRISTSPSPSVLSAWHLRTRSQQIGNPDHFQLEESDAITHRQHHKYASDKASCSVSEPIA